jgi:hypothetical protein
MCLTSGSLCFGYPHCFPSTLRFLRAHRAPSTQSTPSPWGLPPSRSLCQGGHCLVIRSIFGNALSCPQHGYLPCILRCVLNTAGSRSRTKINPYSSPNEENTNPWPKYPGFSGIGTKEAKLNNENTAPLATENTQAVTNELLTTSRSASRMGLPKRNALVVVSAENRVDTKDRGCRVHKSVSVKVQHPNCDSNGAKQSQSFHETSPCRINCRAPKKPSMIASIQQRLR